MPFPRLILLIPLLTTLSGAAGSDFTPEQIQFFESKVRPVLATHCFKCHGPDKQNNGLRLDSRASIIKGADYGPVVTEGKPDASKLLKAIRHEAGVEAMPKEGAKLPDDAIAALTQWIADGLPWPADAAPPPPEKWRAHWAFQPVKMPAAPAPETVPDTFAAWRGSDMDRIIFKSLADAGLTPSPKADRATRIRRAYMALLGFPPSFDEVQDFINDPAPDAWPKLVDELLASPHYGERQARRWMDVARYADTKGYVFQEERRYAYAYTYRDWLIRSFNDDMPYDQFLIRQIAADRATDWQKDPGDLAAMGFLTLGRRFLNNQADIIDDRLDVIFRGTQALTVGCARCHDHKFDPIPTADYYSLYGVFANSHEPDNKPELGKPERTPALEAYEKGVAEREAKAAAYRQGRLDELKKPEVQSKYRTAAAEAGDRAGDALRRFARDRGINLAALTKWIEWRKGPGKDAPADAAPDLAGLKPDDLVPGYNRKEREKHKEFLNAVEQFKATSPAAPARAMVMFDNNTFNDPVVFIRGNPGRPGAKVDRHFLTALAKDKPLPLNEGSGRLQLAKAIASAENPLTARVFVNRLWADLCGDSLVDTPGDFGVRTAPPANPALLDHLAASFAADGWSIKKLTRRILLSAAWQQSSVARPDMAAKDPENKLFWRQNRQRLDFETLRDSLLRVSGALDTRLFGKPEDILTEPFTNRRTIYGFIDRQNLPGLFRTFDFASPDTTAPRRYETVVPQQALYMMNNPFVAAQTRRMVNELHAQPEKDPRHWIAHLFRRIIQREPSPDEMDAHLRAVDALHREPRQTGTRWQHGYGAYDAATKSVSFTAFPWFGKGQWSASQTTPDPQLGYVLLTATGGHPGNNAAHAAIRRWNAPEAATIRITGEVTLPAKESRGVRALIVHSRKGVLWKSDVAPGGKVAAEPGTVAVQPGDTIDFILDNAGDPNSDTFQWSPVIRDTMSGLTIASAAHDFGGPGTSAWEAYAQVLLCTNEFMFVD